MIKNYCIENAAIKSVEHRTGDVMVLVNPSAEEKRWLIDDFQIDEHTLNSSLDHDEISRLEFEPNHVAIIFKRPTNYSSEDQFYFKVSSMGLFLFAEKLIVVTSDSVPLFEGKQFARIESIRDLLLKIISRSIFHFLEHLRVISHISESLEQKINTSMENRYLINMFTLSKSLVYYLNAINANSMVIEKLKLNTGKIGFSQESFEFLDDLVIENTQCYKQAEIYSTILSGLLDARATIVGNNLNVLMKTLNVITIGIMVPTFVVSAFSMNVQIPLPHTRYDFWIIMMLAFLSIVIFFTYWKRKKLF